MNSRTMKHKQTLFLLMMIFLASSAFSQLKLQDLKVDTTITGFHYAADFQGIAVFTKNGASDLNTLNPSAFSFTIAPNSTYQFAVKQLDQLLNMSKENGYKISA